MMRRYGIVIQTAISDWVNKLQISQYKKSTQIWFVLSVCSLFFTFWQFQSRSDGNKNAMAFAQDIDTYIPEGFVLLPIELSNASSLDGLLEAKGVVDLYTAGRSGWEKTAEAIKIIRSPRKPDHFAVLVPEEKIRFLIQKFQSFHAVIQNPNKKGVRIQHARVKNKRSITIELDETNHF